MSNNIQINKSTQTNTQQSKYRLNLKQQFKHSIEIQNMKPGQQESSHIVCDFK